MRFSLNPVKPPLLVAVLSLGAYSLAQRYGLQPQVAHAVLYAALAIGSAIMGQWARDPLLAAWQGYLAALMAFAVVPVEGTVFTDIGRAFAAAGLLGLAPAYVSCVWLSQAKPAEHNQRHT